MLLLILIGGAYAIYADSLVVAILVGSLVIYRSRNPSKFRQRLREAWYARQVTGVESEDVRD